MTFTTGPSYNVRVQMRLIRHGDVPAVVGLMQSIGVHFAGSRSTRVLEAVTRDAADDPSQAMIAVAIDSEPAGLVVAFRQRAAYWRSFARRHPVAALTIAGHRLQRRLRRRAPVSAPHDTRIEQVRELFTEQLVPSGRERWQDDSPDIAKVMYVAVHPHQRGSGIGRALYRWFFVDLAERGVARCDAQVSANNVDAARLHRRFPFRIHTAPGGYFLWLMARDVQRA